jgi:FKBP-type peptidyl-prolyl cis-trans isomerase 2
VLTAGPAGGARPTAADRVRVDYEGKLASDGSVFDSSYAGGQPIDFALGGVIAGWTEALQLMSVGEKARLTIPAALGCGAQGIKLFSRAPVYSIGDSPYKKTQGDMKRLDRPRLGMAPRAVGRSRVARR